MYRRVYKVGGGKSSRHYSHAIVIPIEEVVNLGIKCGDFVDIEIKDVKKRS